VCVCLRVHACARVLEHACVYERKFTAQSLQPLLALIWTTWSATALALRAIRRYGSYSDVNMLCLQPIRFGTLCEVGSGQRVTLAKSHYRGDVYLILLLIRDRTPY
jgi:hypothetical protein